MNRGYFVIGQIRGVTDTDRGGKKRFHLHIELDNFETDKIDLTEDQVNAGLVPSLNKLIGSVCSIPVELNLFNGRLYVRYNSTQAPKVVEPQAKATA